MAGIGEKRQAQREQGWNEPVRLSSPSALAPRAFSSAGVIAETTQRYTQETPRPHSGRRGEAAALPLGPVPAAAALHGCGRVAWNAPPASGLALEDRCPGAEFVGLKLRLPVAFPRPCQRGLPKLLHLHPCPAEPGCWRSGAFMSFVHTCQVSFLLLRTGF